MLWKKGKRRYVWIVGPLVLKIPKFYLVDLHNALSWVIDGRIFRRVFLDGEGRRMGYLKRFRHVFHFLGRCVFSGVLENVHEVTCYFRARSRRKHKLLATLYLPLILVNVYRRENGVGRLSFDFDDLLSAALGLEGRGEFLTALVRCGHTFDNPENFSFNGDEVKILDYGEKRIKNLLFEYEGAIEKLLRLFVKDSA
jgi:hypothetical protein